MSEKFFAEQTEDFFTQLCLCCKNRLFVTKDGFSKQRRDHDHNQDAKGRIKSFFQFYAQLVSCRGEINRKNSSSNSSTWLKSPFSIKRVSNGGGKKSRKLILSNSPFKSKSLFTLTDLYLKLSYLIEEYLELHFQCNNQGSRLKC